VSSELVEQALTLIILYPYSRIFYDKRISAEVAVDSLGDEFKGYVFRITGGNDKQGFPMKQGVLLPSRVRLLLSKGHSCYRPRRTGERKRKSVRGCIVASDMSVLSVTIVKQGEQDLPGLTDTTVPKRLGPKRANNIRKFFVRNPAYLISAGTGNIMVDSISGLSKEMLWIVFSLGLHIAFGPFGTCGQYLQIWTADNDGCV